MTGENDVLTEIVTSADKSRPFHYSDGEEAEEYIWACLRQATDLSTGSEELYRYIRDWPTQYHFSGQRADLLRPFAHRFPHTSILELGSGCGALTRFLAEKGARVTAVEGSPRRADITGERCRDLKNVEVVNENIMDFQTSDRFDFVTLIGVLEYSPMFVSSEDPCLTVLTKAVSLLNATGCLILAIENKLGLKYWAGSPDDHLNQSYAGIEDRYTAASAITFGKAELLSLLDKAGCAYTNCYYPFPDYKFPGLILRDGALRNPALDVASLIQPTLAGRGAFSPYRVVPALLSNHLMADLSNSLLLTGSGTKDTLLAADVLGWSFNSSRKKPFNKTNIFVQSPGEELYVHRLAHHPEIRQEDVLPVVQQLCDEAYITGRLYLLGLADVLSRQGWTVNDIVAWAGPWYEMLESYALPVDGEGMVEGQYIDLVPFNLLEGDEGLSAIDLEWIAEESIPLSYLFFRGLFHSLARLRSAAPPSPATPTNAFGIVLAVMEEYLFTTAGVLEDFVGREARYFGPILLGSQPARDFDLAIRYPESSAASPATVETKLFALLNVQVQIFFETETRGFNEQTSIKCPIGLTRERKVYSVPPFDLSQDICRLRIDPSDHPGLIRIHSIDLRYADGDELFHWTPFSREDIELNGMMILSAAGSIPEPITILLNHDPMMIFTLPEAIKTRTPGKLILEMELSALPGPLTTNVLRTLHHLATLLPQNPLS